MLRHLRSNRNAAALVRGIFNFYGDTVHFTEDASLPKSDYQLDYDSDPPVWRQAVVRLQLGTAHVRESLAHELLHLDTFRRRFPTYRGIEANEGLKPYKDDLIRLVTELRNLVDHEIIQSDFLALGYSEKLFARFAPPAVDYEKEAKKVEASGPNPVNFSVWCLEYSKNWNTSRLCGYPQAAEWAESVRHWGSRVHPDLPAVIAGMHQWLEKGEFRDPTTFIAAFGDLLQLMRLPRVVGWFALEARLAKPPVIWLLDESEG